jgi:hypothetical protein
VVTPGIEPGTSGSVARNSDHQTNDTVFLTSGGLRGAQFIDEYEPGELLECGTAGTCKPLSAFARKQQETTNRRDINVNYWYADTGLELVNGLVEILCLVKAYNYSATANLHT